MQRVLCNGNIEWQMYNGVGAPPHSFPALTTSPSIPCHTFPSSPRYPPSLLLSTLPLSHLHTNYVSGNIVDGNIVHAVIFCTL